ncbi:AmmeMemoRadiSam system protein A [Marinobacteraceae bacterium S3BR75-40.1]
MHSVDAWCPLLRKTTLWLARQSLEQAVLHSSRWYPAPAEIPEEMHAMGACFVSLKQENGRLRGCIGSIEPSRPLVEDIVENSRAAAMRDPRFQPVSPAELAGLHISVSILVPPEPFPVRNEADLLARLRPGIDGLVVEGPGGRRATYLPAVWEQLPDPRDFVRELRRKAGLSNVGRGEALHYQRYQAVEITEGGA